MRNQHIEYIKEAIMAQNTNQRDQQDQRMGNQNANQGPQNQTGRNVGDQAGSNQQSNQHRSGQGQQGTGTNQQGGGFNSTDRTKSSGEAPQQGPFQQQRGNADAQGNQGQRGNADAQGGQGQRGDQSQGAGRQNQPVEDQKGRADSNRR